MSTTLLLTQRMRFASFLLSCFFLLPVARDALAQDAPAPVPPAPPTAPAPAPAGEPEAAEPAKPAAAPPPVEQRPVSYGAPAVHEHPGYPAVEPTYTRPTGQGAFTHDGFYLRLGFGIGYAADSLESNDDGFRIPDPNPRGESASLGTTLMGLAIVTELALGGTPSPGLVVGGGIYSHILTDASSSESDIGGRPVLGADGRLVGASLDRVVFAVFGIMADYYFDPRGGFHVQGALGLGQLLSGAGQHDDNRTFAGAHTATGPGLVLGMGYEWFIAGQWSAGVLLRAAGGLVTGGDDRNLEWDHAIVVPALLATVTYH